MICFTQEELKEQDEIIKQLKKKKIQLRIHGYSLNTTAYEIWLLWTERAEIEHSQMNKGQIKIANFLEKISDICIKEITRGLKNATH